LEEIAARVSSKAGIVMSAIHATISTSSVMILLTVCESVAFTAKLKKLDSGIADGF